jgi:transposase
MSTRKRLRLRRQNQGEVRSLGVIPNRVESIRKLVKKLGPVTQLRVCYEAGPTGYVVYWQLTGLGVTCEVVAPALVPVKPGDRVKTDWRDALKLARSYRAGDLTPVWVPDAAHEALRDLVRARERRRRINCVRAIGWANSCCGTAAAPQPR